VGWSVPTGTPVTLPPRVLSKCDWPAPPFPGSWVFVTENPSVISAAADLATSNHAIRLDCTNGTPSDVEVDSVARLAACGWRLAVRADFDSAGLSHVGSILKATPEAVPWRMRVRVYLESLPSITANKVSLNEVPDTPWDAALSKTILQHGVAAFEESLLPNLIADLGRGLPGVGHPPQAVAAPKSVSLSQTRPVPPDTRRARASSPFPDGDNCSANTSLRWA